MKTITKTFLIVCLATTALALPARAGEEPKVVGILLANWEKQLKVKPAYESVDQDSSGAIKISKLTVNKAAEAGGPAFTIAIDQIDLVNIADQGDGLYDIGSAKFTGTKFDVTGVEGQAFSVSIPEASAEDLFVRAAGDTPKPEDALLASMNLAKKTTSGKITLTVMGQTITADGYETSWDGDPKTGAGTFSGKIGNIVIPESTMAMVDTGGMLKQLGYGSLAFDFAVNYKLDVADDKLGVDGSFAYVGRNMGTMKVAFGAGGVPLAVIGELKKAQADGKQPDFTAMLPELQAVTVTGASLRFEDASITKKLLPMLAAMQGMDEAALVNNAGAQVQMGLMALNNPEFATKVSGAVAAFLKEPKSITVALKPAAPVMVQELMSLNPADPGAAITKLGITVTSND
ncbi:MAG: hypothetical protein HY245_13060 [Rhizobiales bacterium]|nr:hypothetical protein [Hyphomicrobiales bacterium]MBI3674319.1 hypothetical protein [Hyphomicrobiales bacterium]